VANLGQLQERHTSNDSRNRLFLCLLALRSSPFFFLTGAFLCGGGLLVQFVVSLTSRLVLRRQDSRWWFIPPLICSVVVLTAPLDIRIGTAIADWRFKKQLPQFAKIVDDVRSGVIPCGTTFDQISPQNTPSNVEDITALRHPDGAVIVMFSVGSAFPLAHYGYLCDGCSQNTNCIREFEALAAQLDIHLITNGWYYFAK
jgi:hypothetical protein